MTAIDNWLEEAPRLSHFEIAPQDWRDALGDLVQALHPGSSRVLADSPGEDQFYHVMPQAIRGLMESAERDVVISNAYIVPDREARSEEHTSELQSLMRISYAVFCLK